MTYKYILYMYRYMYYMTSVSYHRGYKILKTLPYMSMKLIVNTYIELYQEEKKYVYFIHVPYKTKANNFENVKIKNYISFKKQTKMKLHKSSDN